MVDQQPFPELPEGRLPYEYRRSQQSSSMTKTETLYSVDYIAGELPNVNRKSIGEMVLRSYLAGNNMDKDESSIRNEDIRIDYNDDIKQLAESLQSEWKKQETGIRQGCPLSPYLFLILMTVMFHDIHADEQLNEELKEDRILGAMFDEILYADDTIIHSTTSDKVAKLLHKIQEQGRSYGLKLNKDKCEAMTVRGISEVYFQEGGRVKEMEESRYLGCYLNNETKASRELNKRMGDVVSTWKRLEVFWKHSNTCKRTQLHIYDAIIKSKLLYAHETANLTAAQQNRLDPCQ